jgi:hypothetical protein
MAQIKVVLPNSGIVSVSSNNLNEQQLANSVNNRQRIAYDYCQSKGWPTDPTELSFDQILEIRKQQNWIDAGKN